MTENIKNKGANKFTFHQWLNGYECITKREFKDFPESKKNYYKREYDAYLKSQESEK